MNDLNVWSKANQLNKEYLNRFMLICGVVSSNITLYTTLSEDNDMKSGLGCFDLIFVAASFNPSTASM